MKQIEKTLKILRRSPYQALAAGLAMTLTFFVGTIFVILLTGGQLTLNHLEQRPELYIFFHDEVTDDKINEVAELTKTTGYVKDTKLITKDEALAIYRERLKDDPTLLESVTADFLPRSLQVSLTKPEGIIEVTNVIKGRGEVERTITLSEEALNNFIKTIKAVRLGGMIFVLAQMTISFLIIVMVIGMRIAIRREEISIMNLVGATKFYIAKPFLIEGAFYGLVGATLSVLAVYIILLFYSPQIQSFLGPIQVFPIHPLFFIYLWLGETLVAVSLGAAAAAISLFRYLKVS